MELQIANVVFDCADPVRLARFWSDVTGFRLRPGLPPLDDPSWADAEWLGLRPPTGGYPRIGFQRVPEPKVVKNRVHLDLQADDEEATAEWIQSLGATFLWRSEDPEDPFVTLADPEGNEFCVIRTPPAAPGG